MIYLEQILTTNKTNNKNNLFLYLDIYDLYNNYTQHLNTQITMSFINKNDNILNTLHKYKSLQYIKEIISITQLHTSFEYYQLMDKELFSTDTSVYCVCCNNIEWKMESKYLVCIFCGYKKHKLNLTSISFLDIDRINLPTKHQTYNRKLQFDEDINKFEGKYSSRISDKMIIKIKHLLIENSITTNNKCIDIERQLFYITKKELIKYIQFFDNFKELINEINYIYYKITGIYTHDLTHIREKLNQDFETLSELYDSIFKKKNTNIFIPSNLKVGRKNFINRQIVLYHLLHKHNYYCKLNDFNLSKTIDRQIFNDNMCKFLFEHLGWNFKSLF